MEQLEENLRLSPEERLMKHDKLVNEWLEFEAFMKEIYRGWIFIHSQHGNTR